MVCLNECDREAPRTGKAMARKSVESSTQKGLISSTAGENVTTLNVFCWDAGLLINQEILKYERFNYSCCKRHASHSHMSFLPAVLRFNKCHFHT
jgi:hypothetical protein